MKVTYCPICHQRVLPEAETGWLHVHYAEDILSPERLAELARRFGRDT